MSQGSVQPANLMTLAQRGRHDEASAAARSALDEPGRSPEERLGLLYALSCAEFFAGRLPEAETASTGCVTEAAAMGHDGWQANALAVRAMVRESAQSAEAALDDAIEAEVLLNGCDDPGQRNWCYSGLGSVYTALRLYELALPHFLAAIETPDQALPYEDGELVDHFNLADLHLRWSRELERVGLDDLGRRREHAQHLQEAQRWISSGAALVSRGARASWLTAFERMRAQVASVTEPSTSLLELERVRGEDLAANRHDDAVQSTTALARAHRLLGDVPAAQRIASEAVAMLRAGGDSEHTTSLDAYYQLHRAQVAAGLPGTEGVAGYVALTTTLLWEQRSRSVDGVRARRDYAVLQSEHAENHRLAREDPLTKLANRRALDEWLHEHRTGPAALVLIDLDGFKAINDSLGHASGDIVLMRVAGALRSTARDRDLVARYGGDEFVVVVDGDSLDVEGLAQRTAEAIAGIDLSDLGPGLRATATVGTARVDKGGATRALLAEADRLLLRHKRGRSRPAPVLPDQPVSPDDVTRRR